MRFNDKHIHGKVIINVIISSVYLSGSKTNKTSGRDIREFTILKCFKVIWIKVNTDDAATKNTLNVSAGGIFRDRNGVCIGFYAQNLGTVNAFCAELVAAMLAMEIAQRKGYTSLWL